MTITPDLLNIAIYVPIVVSAGILYRNWPYLKIRLSEQQNDNMLAAANFLALLKEAEQEMCVYNDGNTMHNGMYDNGSVTQNLNQFAG